MILPIESLFLKKSIYYHRAHTIGLLLEWPTSLPGQFYKVQKLTFHVNELLPLPVYMSAACLCPTWQAAYVDCLCIGANLHRRHAAGHLQAEEYSSCLSPLRVVKEESDVPANLHVHRSVGAIYILMRNRKKEWAAHKNYKVFWKTFVWFIMYLKGQHSHDLYLTKCNHRVDCTDLLFPAGTYIYDNTRILVVRVLIHSSSLSPIPSLVNSLWSSNHTSDDLVQKTPDMTSAFLFLADRKTIKLSASYFEWIFLPHKYTLSLLFFLRSFKPSVLQSFFPYWFRPLVRGLNMALHLRFFEQGNCGQLWKISSPQKLKHQDLLTLSHLRRWSVICRLSQRFETLGHVSLVTCPLPWSRTGPLCMQCAPSNPALHQEFSCFAKLWQNLKINNCPRTESLLLMCYDNIVVVRDGRMRQSAVFHRARRLPATPFHIHWNILRAIWSSGQSRLHSRPR